MKPRDRAASTKANHWEQVDNWICAPADNSPHLGLLDLALDDWVLLLGCGSSETNQELVHNIEEEAHGGAEAPSLNVSKWAKLKGYCTAVLFLCATNDLAKHGATHCEIQGHWLRFSA